MNTKAPVLRHFYIQSRSEPDKRHTVKLYDHGGLSCPCKGWIFSPRWNGGVRTCEHVRRVELMLGRVSSLTPNRVWTPGMAAAAQRQADHLRETVRAAKPSGADVAAALSARRLAKAEGRLGGLELDAVKLPKAAASCADANRYAGLELEWDVEVA